VVRIEDILLILVLDLFYCIYLIDIIAMRGIWLFLTVKPDYGDGSQLSALGLGKEANQ